MESSVIAIIVLTETIKFLFKRIDKGIDDYLEEKREKEDEANKKR